MPILIVVLFWALFLSNYRQMTRKCDKNAEGVRCFSEGYFIQCPGLNVHSVFIIRRFASFKFMSTKTCFLEYFKLFYMYRISRILFQHRDIKLLIELQ